MLPRQRIFRSVLGRAASVMRLYDQGLEEHGRLNHAGPSAALRVLKDSRPRQYQLCDFLWNQGHLDVLFIELWRLNEAQINRLSNPFGYGGEAQTPILLRLAKFFNGFRGKPGRPFVIRALIALPGEVLQNIWGFVRSLNTMFSYSDLDTPYCIEIST